MNDLRIFLKNAIITRYIPEDLKENAQMIVEKFRNRSYCSVMPVMINGEIAIIGRVKNHDIKINGGSKFRIIFVYFGRQRNETLFKPEQRIILKKFIKSIHYKGGKNGY